MIVAALVAAIGRFGSSNETVPRPERRLLVVDLMPPTPQASAPDRARPPSSDRQVAPQPPSRAPSTVTPTPLRPIAEPRPAVAVPLPVTAPAPLPQAAAAPLPAPPPAAPVDLSATMIDARPPGYPAASRRLREQGTVVLRVVVARDGRVATVALARSSGYDRLDDAALAAVRRWRWSPVTRDGETVEVVGTVRIPFVLKG